MAANREHGFTEAANLSEKEARDQMRTLVIRDFGKDMDLLQENMLYQYMLGNYDQDEDELNKHLLGLSASDAGSKLLLRDGTPLFSERHKKTELALLRDAFVTDGCVWPDEFPDPTTGVPKKVGALQDQSNTVRGEIGGTLADFAKVLSTKMVADERRAEAEERRAEAAFQRAQQQAATPSSRSVSNFGCVEGSKHNFRIEMIGTSAYILCTICGSTKPVAVGT